MLTVIGSKNCGKCEQVRSILGLRKIKFKFKLIEDLEPKEQDNILKKATDKGFKSFPLFFKAGNEITKLTEVLS